MNASHITLNINENFILLFFTLGGILTTIGICFNLCLCLLFCYDKSLYKSAYGIFIISLSIADIIKLMSEYVIHIAYIYIKHPYFVCSITWFLTMTSENLSYLFLFVLGIERNFKIRQVNRRYFLTRQCACSIIIFLVLFVLLYDHLFLFIPLHASYYFVRLFNQSILFSCTNAYYQAYGYRYSLSDLIFLESIGLNNFILPVLILISNILLIIALKHRLHQRRYCLHRRRIENTWKHQSVIVYMCFTNFIFLLLTTPVGIVNAWSVIVNKRIAVNHFVILFDLMEILHHCSHFPILLLTSSVIRQKIMKNIS